MNKTYLIDLDGTMYRGSQIQPGAKAFLDALQKNNQTYIFLTNNSKRTLLQNVEHMENMGFTNITCEQFFTSAMASARYVAKHYQQRKAMYIGEDGLAEALLQQGFILTENQPDFVFVGLHQSATYEMYSKALNELLKGAVLIGTNNDRILAQPGCFAVGNGSIVHMLEYASKQTSPRIGKPYAPILEEALAAFSLQKEDVILVGDNLETDILLGVNEGVESIFVLGGVHEEADKERLQIFPNRTIHNLMELIEK